jgi:hypothetical protein
VKENKEMIHFASVVNDLKKSFCAPQIQTVSSILSQQSSQQRNTGFNRSQRISIIGKICSTSQISSNQKSSLSPYVPF